MKLTLNLILILCFVCINSLKSQVYFSEGFESGLPSGWTQVYGNSWGGDTINWKFQNGGYTFTPAYISTRHPYPAHSGVKNALFHKSSGFVSTKLVTRSIDLTIARKPYLKFWHAQDSTYFMGGLVNDELKVYYKKTIASPWVLLAEYTQAQALWNERQIELPKSSLTGTYYIAFEGKSNSAYGSCIDDVSIVETDTFPKTVQNITGKQTDNSNVITGSTLNPILRLHIFVAGNSGNLTLDSLTILSKNSNDNDILNTGVKLYSTSDSLFHNPQFIAQTSFISSSAKFYPLNHYLSMGSNYIWVTYDINESAGIDNILDLTIPPNSIKISTRLFPSSAIDPPGSRNIIKSVFYDEFSTDKGWLLSTNFEIADAQGLGGKNYGYPDPSAGYSGTKLLGTDITTNNGDYPKSYYYSATTPELNCSYFKNIKLSFMRWLNVNGADRASIELSTDNGSTWPVTLWTNSGDIKDNNWKNQVFNISQYADRKNNIKIRFTLGPTGDRPYSGWNIDNFTVYGEYLAKDVGVVNWLSPLTDCGHTAKDSVKIVVENFAALPISNIPVAYSFDGGTNLVKDTIKFTIQPLQNATFTFKQTVNLLQPNIFNDVTAFTQIENDQYLENNSVNLSVTSLPTYHSPFSENFDNGDNFWIYTGSWQLGMPAAFDAASLPYAYECHKFFDEDSYVKSPCIIIDDTSKIIVELKLNTAINHGAGAALYYSTDNETTWNLVPNHSYSWKWNWYNNNSIPLLANAGWDTSSNAQWFTAKQVLPKLNTSNIKFKLAFKSNNYGSEETFAFDDFKIYEAPANVKINAITSHTDNCIKSLPSKISFSIKNNGIRTLIPSKDTIFASYIVNAGDTISDTLLLKKNLPINGIDTLTFKQPYKFTSTGTSSIKIFLSDKYYGFYPVPDRDTLSVNISIYPNPVTGLASHISARNLNTLTVRTGFSDTANYKYNWANASNTSLSKSDTLYAPTEGKIWLSLMKKDDIHLCTTTDTIMVNKLISNIAVDSLVSPVNSCLLGSNVVVKLSLKNVGTDTLEIGDSIKVAYKFETQDTVRFKQIVNKRLIPGDTIIATFLGNTVNMSTKKTYTFTTFARYNLDLVKTNDTLKRNITVWGLPVVNLGPDATVPGIATLHAGPGFKSYLWIDGSTDSTYKARFIGDHWVDVEDSHGCKNRDSIKLKVVFYDIKPDTIENPVTSCTLGSEKFKVRIKNTGTDTIDAGVSIKLKYKIDQGSWYFENYVLPSNFLPETVRSYTFTKSENLSDTGKYTITMITETTDVFPDNDTLIYNVRNYGNPAISLGNDTTVKALSYVLKIKKDTALNYLWKNNLTDTSYLVTRTDTVFIKATNKTTSCFTKDTVKINLSIRDGLLKSATRLFKSCKGTLDSIKVTFINNGNEVIPANDTVWYWYKLGNYTSEKSFSKLTSSLQPKDSIKLSFKGLKNRLPIGNSQLILYSQLRKDLRTNNNNDTVSIQILQLPPADITGFNIDTVITTPPYKLNAPVGAQYSYNWQDGSHANYFSVTTTGLYFVQITDNNSCVNYDSVYVEIYTPDGSITSVTANASSVCEGETLPIKAWFKNTGSTSLIAGDRIYFDYRIKNRTTSYPYTVKSTLKAGDSISFTFSNVVPDLISGLNNIKVFAVLGEDNNPNNDTSTIAINYNLQPNFILAEGKDTVTYSYGTKFGVNLGKDYNYLWNTGSSNDSIYLTKGGKYTVLVSNKLSNCSKSDSVFIQLDVMNGGIAEESANSEYCQKSFNSFTVTFENTGNTKILQGQTIIFSYILNNNEEISENEILGSDLYPGDDLEHTFSGLSNAVITGINKFKVYSHFLGDAIPDDDTLSFTVEIKALPNIIINNAKDTVFSGLPVTLYVGEGNYSYKWQNGSTNKTYLAIKEGKYNVAVTDNTTECISYDTVYVSALYFDGGITSISANTAACMGTFDHFDASMTNNGDLAFRSGDSIKFAYKVNNGAPVIDGIKLISDIVKGGKITHTFNNVASKVNSGTNNFKVFSIVPGDTIAKNDTMSFSVKINPLPSVEIGNGKDTIIDNKTVILTAGEATGYTYTWHDGSTTNTYTAKTSGKYYVKVTNAITNCSASDTVVIIINNNDVALTAFSGATTGCLGKYGTLSVKLSNMGNENIAVGDTIFYGLKVNGNQKFYDTVKVTTAVLPTQETTYNIFNADKYLSLGTNLVKAYVVVKKDTYHSNDTANKTIQISNYPTITLAGGSETISFKTSYILDAGSGYASYQWNTAATTQSINVTSAGWYKVTVSNAGGCKAKDSVYMKPTLGIGQSLAENELKIYPNPATESVNIEMQEIALINPLLEIYDIDKKLVYSKKFEGKRNEFKVKLSIANFNKGIYMVTVSDDSQKIFIKKLIIK